jgi:hypothetical protein
MVLRAVDTPFLEIEEDEEPTGKLQPIASSILMKLLYGARIARWDLLKGIQVLSTRVTKWNVSCDRALHRLICYVACTANHVLVGFVGDGPEAFRLRQYADADFAGDRPGFKSTSGAFLSLTGPHTHFPLSAKAVRQTCVAHSTPEAEMVSANSAIRLMGLPSLDLWEVVLGRKIALDLIEDNESTVQIIKTGKNPTMRHMSRTHGVNVMWLHDLYHKGIFGMTYTRTEAQCADIFTKTFSTKVKWLEAIDLVGIRAPGSPPKLPPEPGPRPPKEETEQVPKSLPKGKKTKRQELGRRGVSHAATPAPVERSPDYEVLLWHTQEKRVYFCSD